LDSLARLDSCQLVCAFSLHQFLIEWVDNEVEIVHADSSAYATAGPPLLGGMMI